MHSASSKMQTGERRSTSSAAIWLPPSSTQGRVQNENFSKRLTSTQQLNLEWELAPCRMGSERLPAWLLSFNA